ncbi:alpha beta hydrolase domain-containing 11 [Micractinium conductrix]|uniref:Alpha beta hydrolase domain-containing 11 n=1 Tax=Micractinium conductrix TaxID=554055 RepID=A0A2P6VRS8_9CHLO|nr:alpha beta hydrolase domain-containing 11 [Micractinium conductrix]|eukprot:PSC76793.1 alpha beta hydrolase domain-containing 11 [Micractinium conductrix]
MTSQAAQQQLHFEAVEAPPPAAAAGAAADRPPLTAVVLHGLLGTGRNLRSVMADLCRQAAAGSGVPWRALLVDLRCHGRSARLNLHPPHNLAAAAGDVVALLQRQAAEAGAPPAVLVGHSMGGKTALEVVRQLGQAGAPVLPPKQVWVLDARPTAVHVPDAATAEVQHVLETVAALPLPFPSRQALYAQLAERGFSPALQQWLGGNLTQESAGRYVWAFNVAGAQALFADYCKQDYAALLRAPPRGLTLNILRALRSDRWDHDTLAAVRGAVAATALPAAVRGRTRFHELPDAGHWVHTDNPRGLVSLMLPSMLEAAGA